MERWRKHYEATPGSAPIVEEQVRQWYAQILVETVLGSDAMRGSRWWTEADLDGLLSEEALTAAVQPRYFIEERLKRDLARILGSAPALAIA